jgi:hypothetical protein
MSNPTPGFQDAHEQWDGTSWTELANISGARSRVLGTGISQNSIIVAGGANTSPGLSAQTEFWNGSAWTELNDMATARYAGSATPASSSTSSLFSGGGTTVPVATTEEWSAPPISIKTFTTS